MQYSESYNVNKRMSRISSKLNKSNAEKYLMMKKLKSLEAELKVATEENAIRIQGEIAVLKEDLKFLAKRQLNLIHEWGRLDDEYFALKAEESFVYNKETAEPRILPREENCLV